MDPQRLLVSDLDGTLLGDEVALERFRDWFAAQRQSWRLVFATGRTVESVMAIVAAGDLPAPDAIVSNVGADIHDPVGGQWPGWPTSTDRWDLELVRTCLAQFPRDRPAVRRFADGTEGELSRDRPVGCVTVRHPDGPRADRPPGDPRLQLGPRPRRAAR